MLIDILKKREIQMFDSFNEKFLKPYVPNEADPDMSEEQRISMPACSKIPGLKFDIEKLKEWLFTEVEGKYTPVWVDTAPGKEATAGYGGWTITSHSGDVRDGWESTLGFDKNRKYDFKRAYFHGFRPRFWQTNGTQIYKGYITELIQTLEEGGFFPRQCRVWKFPPGHRIGEHSDASENMYAVRLHIPIVTNPKAVHRWYYNGKMIEDHMEADGSAYLIRTNVWHDAGNFGDEDRYHFVCEAWDTRHTTPGFGYDNIQRVIDRAQKRVDDTEKFLKANPDWVADSWRGDKAHGTKTV